MAFTVEDGSGVTGANAYATAAQVTEYLTDRGREAENNWSTKTAAEQQTAIIKATDYIEKRFFGIWRGSRTDSAQALTWPRPESRLPMESRLKTIKFPRADGCGFRICGPDVDQNPASRPGRRGIGIKRGSDRDVQQGGLNRDQDQVFGPGWGGGSLRRRFRAIRRLIIWFSRI